MGGQVIFKVPIHVATRRCRGDTNSLPVDVHLNNYIADIIVRYGLLHIYIFLYLKIFHTLSSYKDFIHYSDTTHTLSGYNKIAVAGNAIFPIPCVISIWLPKIESCQKVIRAYQIIGHIHLNLYT